MPIPVMPVVIAAGLLSLLAAGDSPGPPPTVPQLEAALRTASLAAPRTTKRARHARYGAEDDLQTAPTTEQAALRPAELVLRMDLREVPDHLLLAVLLAGATGGRDPVDAATSLLSQANGDLWELDRADLHRAVPGLGTTAQARVLAARELYRRAAYRQAQAELSEVTQPRHAWQVLRTMPHTQTQEFFAAIFLGRGNRVLATRVLTVGNDACAIVCPRLVFRTALSLGASSVILAHNHPSGDTGPSDMDRTVTRRIVDAGKTVGIDVLDHIVMTPLGYTSMAEEGIVHFIRGPSVTSYVK